jgi:hypothetical protein
MKDKKEFDYFDRPENIKRLWIALYVLCGLTVLPDFFLQREGHFAIDHYCGFYAFLGFVSCAALILFSKLVGFVLKVREDYYDR